MINEEKKPPMYFASLKIKNVKCFGEEQVLELTNDDAISQWTLILGNNGLGKTTLLKCITWMTTVEESDPNKKKEGKIEDSMVAVKPFMDGIEDAEYEQLARIGTEVETTVSATLTIGTKLNENPKKGEFIEYSIQFKTINGKLYEVLPPKLAPLKEFNSPNIYAYSASRHMELQNLDRTELFDPVSNLFSDSGELYDATEQLLFQDHASLQENPKGRETAVLEKLKELIADLLPEVKSATDITIHAKERAVKIKTDDGSVPLESLSLGYKTMVAWSVDLALKMVYQNPDSDNPLEEPAVVIIDEIDLHLHPKWQRELKGILIQHFPNTQFICTAHSPFMAQSSEDENLAVLQRDERRNNEVKIENDPVIVKDWRIGQIITSDLFGVESERSPEVEEAINKRRVLLDKLSFTELSEEEMKNLQDLDDRLSNLPIEIEPNDQNLKMLKKLQNISKLVQETKDSQ